MKLQVINSPNNITHKAYFKPNTEFKYLWAVRPTNMNTMRNKLENFSFNLPAHELEIIKTEILYDGVKDSKFIYTIFNNVTKKAKDVILALSGTKNIFESIIDDLLVKNERNNYFFRKDATNILDYKMITEPMNDNNE
ncbi:hypothetical protein J6R97_08080 [bacterium]|nr:hypothetical protein [bacterium]